MNIFESIKNFFDFMQISYGQNLYIQKTHKTEDTSSFDKVPPQKKSSKLSKTLPQIDFFNSAEDWIKSSNINELENKIKDCQKCPLGQTRTKFVFGYGNPNAEIMVIGEAPGADEDLQGLPFVGRAGQLLTNILKSINLSREEVFICNILKCRPPNNRKPLPNEIQTCIPYLHKQIELIQPKIILALGSTAIEGLLGITAKMADIHGKVMEFNGITLIPTYHPAALLRNPSLKRDVWNDLQNLMKIYYQIKEKAK